MVPHTFLRKTICYRMILCWDLTDSVLHLKVLSHSHCVYFARFTRMNCLSFMTHAWRNSIRAICAECTVVVWHSLKVKALFFVGRGTLVEESKGKTQLFKWKRWQCKCQRKSCPCQVWKKREPQLFNLLYDFFWYKNKNSLNFCSCHAERIMHPRGAKCKRHED